MILKVIDFYVKIIILLIKILMISLIFFVALMLLGRYIPFIPRYLWTDEGSKFCLIWGVFLSSALSVREEKHFYVNIFSRDLPKLVETVLRLLYYLSIFLVALIFIIYGKKFFLMGLIQHSEITDLNLATIYISIPITGISWAIFLIENFLKEFKIFNKT